MKRAEKLYLLLGILVVSCGVTLGVSKYEEKKEVIKNSDEVILTLKPENVQSLSWKNESETLAFHREDSWIYDEDEAFPVDEEKINELLEQFEEFGVSFIIENVEDYGQYGLESPVCTIDIKTEEESYEILLGDYSKMDSERYVSVGDGNVYLVKHDPLDEFDAVLKDMIDHDETPDFDKVTGIQFAGAENYQLVYEEESSDTYCDEDIYFTEQEGKSLPLDTSRVNAYLQTISQLDPTDYVTYNVTDEELKNYGLDEPELSVTVQYTDMGDEDKETEETFVLHLGRDPKEMEKAEKEAEDETSEEVITAYARIGESKIIYSITPESYKNLMAASYNSLRHQEVLSADFADVEQIDIFLEGADYTITSKGKEDKRTYYYESEELEIGELSSALKALKADSFTDEEPIEKEEISLTLHLDHENFSEIKIDLFRYDGTNCLAVIDGEPVSLVKRAAVVDLMEAVHAIVLD